MDDRLETECSNQRSSAHTGTSSRSLVLPPSLQLFPSFYLCLCTSYCFCLHIFFYLCLAFTYSLSHLSTSHKLPPPTKIANYQQTTAVHSLVCSFPATAAVDKHLLSPARCPVDIRTART